MKFLKLIPILLIFFGNFPYKNLVHAEVKNTKDYKVLSNESKKLSISNVEYYLKSNIKDFNIFLNEKMTQEEEKALKNVGR